MVCTSVIFTIGSVNQGPARDEIPFRGVLTLAHRRAADGRPAKAEKVRDFAVCCHCRKSLNVRNDDWSCHYFPDDEAKQKEGSKLFKGGPEFYITTDNPHDHNNFIAAESDRTR